MNFFEELKRRNVYKVTVAYIVTAWLVFQFTNTVTGVWDLPVWVPRLVFLFLLIGLVPTVIASWALELTPEGIRLEKDVDRSKSVTGQTGRKLNYFTIGMLVLVIAGLVFERVFLADVGEAPAVVETVTEAERSVAVLPFSDFSENQDQEWFAFGLADEILNVLARTPDILVASRTSAFAYKDSDKDLQTVAEELLVAHVLEGSIRAGDGRLRITAQLIRAADGFHLWSQTYDVDAEDIIGVQEDVSLKIAGALQTTMDPEALQDMMRVGTRSVRAYRAYLRALALRVRALRTAETGNYESSYEQFELARSIDPKFAAAHREAAKHWQILLNPTRGGTSTDLAPAEILENFLARIDLAIDTAKDPVEESGSKAQKAVVQLRLRTAIRRFQTYLEARPNDYRAWHELLIVAQLAADRESADEALAALKSGGEFDRFAATTYIRTAYRFGAASAAADYGLAALERWPNDAGIAYQTHRSLLWASRVDDAARLFARVKEIAARSPVIRARQVCSEGRSDDVLEILEKLRAEEGDNVGAEWVILKMLGRDQESAELVRRFESNGVPFQLASWLVFPTFDPAPFPTLMKMLERENVQRPPVGTIPFACPTVD